MKRQFLVPVLATLAFGTFSAQSPRTHRLEATPATISYGYYRSEAKPVLRIASGDIIDGSRPSMTTPVMQFEKYLVLPSASRSLDTTSEAGSPLR